MHSNILELDTKSLKQKEILYQIDFKIQQLERKVARASGKRTLEETIAFTAKIRDLEEMLNESQEKYKMLHAQVFFKTFLL